MNRNYNYRSRIVSMVAIILLLLSTILPTMIHAKTLGVEDKQKLHQSLNVSNLKQNKISDRLLKEYEKNEKVTFLVKFTEKADTEMAAMKGKEKAQQQNLSAYKTDIMQRSEVVSALKSTAYESQEQVKTYLEKEKENGHVDKLKSYYIVNGMAVTATKEVAEKIAEFPEVDKLLPNEKRQLYTPVEESSGKEKLNNDIEWNIERVKAKEAWDMGVDGTGTVVASIDSGVQWDHPALKEKYRGYDPETGEVNHDFNWYDPVFYDDVPYDDMGHGTHVTGTMVGSEPDGTNQIGVAPGAKWISVKAFSNAGGFDADLLAAAEWIIAPTDYEGNERIDMAPDIVNNSWGGGPGLDEWYRDVVRAWRNANIFPEFSAGNTDLFNPGGPGSVVVPANYPESFATGATDMNDELAEFSLRGPSPYDEIKPDISAPGDEVRSAVPDDGYTIYSGTSMAGPAVSGVAALLRQINSTMSVDEMEDVLLNTSIPLTDEEYPDSPNNGYGYGLVNAEEAVTTVIEGYGKIEGVVTKEGQDDELPTYTHTPITDVYSNMNLEVQLEASDNVGVTSVELRYKVDQSDWQMIEGDRISGDHISGEYQATIPSDALVGEQLNYQWIIKDFSDNETKSETYQATIHTGITVGYFEDFENEPSDWTSFGRHDSWEWGLPTSGPEEASVGEHVYATNLAGDYDYMIDATLVMPQITLPEGEAYLQFDQWYSFIGPSYPGESGDYGYVVVSTDQNHEEWTRLMTITDKSDGWERAEIDLSSYSGQSISIGFQATSDYYWESDGWYLDAVALSDVSLDDQETNKESKHNLGLRQMDSSGLLPLEAQVSILESGKSVYTDPATGEYSINHEVGTYTAQAEAYGYQSEIQEVSVQAENNQQTNFTLEEIPQATISGQVLSETSGDPVESATLLLTEDANIEPIQTDENGNFSLTAYEGKYTLKVISKEYYNKEIEIELQEDMELTIELEPFVTVPGGEIGYDDGIAENARAFYDAGNGWAVKMSLPEDKDYAIVTDGIFQFHDEDWPTPGGEGFEVEVWDATGSGGLPGEKIAGPIEARAIRDLDEWTVIDLREHDIIVDGDFYMVYIQTEDNPYAPGLATDENGPNAGRSYQYVEGAFEQTPMSEGNYMIRAGVAYEIEKPKISSPSNDLMTNEPELTVEGTASPGSSIKLISNEEESDTALVDEDGHFSIPMLLDEGANEIKAVAVSNGEGVKESDTVHVTLDTEAPVVTIDSPSTGEKTNRETIIVEGTIKEEHIDYVEINGQTTAIVDNKFSKRVILDNGENIIEVEAVDLAGNSSIKSTTVFAQYEAPEIQNLTPNDDVFIETGESLEIRFDSAPDMKASFVIHMPLIGPTLTNATELPLIEVADGQYVGYWTVPQHAFADGARIEVIVRDEFNNESREIADGKLFINR